MKYDFTSLMDRHGHDALAVDGLGTGEWTPKPPKDGFDIIPMWVADMNFKVFPEIQREIIARVNEPHFGYFIPRDEYADSIIRWQRDHNHMDVKKENIGYENGVLGGVVSALSSLASPGAHVLVHSPTYIGFTHACSDAGYHLVHSPLLQDENKRWYMDYQDMEEKIKAFNIHIAIFCSPHNPCGRVWEKEEIEKAMELFKKYDVTVISDEIWSDILLNGNVHIPTQSVSPDAKMRTIAFYAPSKTFNLAGLIGSYHIIYNKRLKDTVTQAGDRTHYNSMNVLSQYALIGGYSEEGDVWVDELRKTLSENINFAYDFIRENFKGVSLFKPEGTYMLYLDVSEYLKSHNMEFKELFHRGNDYGIAWQNGEDFLKKDTIRMNLALPYSRVQEAFLRLKKYVFTD